MGNNEFILFCGSGSELGDGKHGGITGKDCVIMGVGIHLIEEIRFEFEILGCRLHNKIRVPNSIIQVGKG